MIDIQTLQYKELIGVSLDGKFAFFDYSTNTIIINDFFDYSTSIITLNRES